MKISRTLVNKIENGDSINDDELSAAIDFYSKMLEGLSYLGREYILARTPISNTLHRLEGYQRSREMNRRK